MTKRILPIAAALAVALSPALAAAAPRVDAQLSAPEVEVGQAAQLAVTVSGAEGQPRVPRVPGLTIHPIGSSQQLTIMNGVMDRQTTHHYQLVPERAGTFTVGPVSVGGARAAPLRLTATSGTARSRGRAAAPAAGRSRNAPRTTVVEEPAGRRAFLTVDVDRNELVVGESMPVTVRAYVKAGTSGTITGAPELSSDAFAIHDLVEDAQQGRAEIRGTPYATLTWRGKMTALLPGEHEVSATVPATLEWRELVRTERSDPFAGRGRSMLERFFDDPRFGSAFDDPFFSGSPFGSGGLGAFTTTSWGPSRSARVSLEDDVGTVTVREPPEEGRPDDYDGAVGRFVVSAEATPTIVRAGEPITLRLRVRGEGSFDRVHHGLLPEDTEGMRTYPVTEQTEVADGRSGEKVFEQSLVPTEAGLLTLPSLALSYYDPERGEYVTARTEPMEIDVQPSADGASPVADLDAVVGPSGRGLSPNAVAPGAFVPSLRPVPEHPWPWLAAMLTMGVALGAAVALRRRDRDAAAKKTTHRAARRALRAAKRAMREAAGRGDATAFFLAARTAVQRRLGAAWGVPPEAVTLAEAEARLERVPDAMRGALERADAVEFAGANPSHEDLEEWLQRVERALDEEIER